MRRATALSGIAALSLAGCSRLQARVQRLTVRCPDAPVPVQDAMVLLSGTLRTPYAHEPVAYSFMVAQGADRRTVDRAIYLLPGRGSTARDALDESGAGYGGAYTQAVRLIPALRRSMLLVVDAGESYFHRRASGEDRLAVVRDEFPKIVARFTGARPRREALIGQSMGGYGALLAAVREPSRYRSVAVAGPALFRSYAEERAGVGDAFDDAADFARNDVIALAGRLRKVPVMVRCGDQDPFAPAVRAFAARCPSADVAIVPGCHDTGFWRATSAELLRFTAAHL